MSSFNARRKSFQRFASESPNRGRTLLPAPSSWILAFQTKIWLDNHTFLKRLNFEGKIVHDRGKGLSDGSSF
jgi:hypothetical protein